MIIHNHNFVGATLAVARSNIKGRDKPCPTLLNGHYAQKYLTFYIV